MPQLFGLARLGRDAELRFTQAGDPVASLALAFTYGKKGQDGKRPTQWVEAAIWGARAESLAPYLLKGTSISVTVDEVHIETYDRTGGGQGFKLVGRVSNLEFAGSPPSASAPPSQQQRPAPTQRPAAQPAQSHGAASLADMDDDIPFDCGR